MSTGSTTGTSSVTSINNTIPQFNPNQFGLGALPNGGFFNGLGAIPLGGFGATGSVDSGDFSSLLSSLNSSGTFGPGLFNNLGPPGTNPTAIAVATEASSAATTAVLNKFAPLDLPPEALYSSSVFGNLTSGQSFFDTASTMANGVAGLFNFSDSTTARLALSVGPAIGAIGGIFGVLQGFRVALNTPTAKAQSTQDAVQDYFAPEDPLDA